MPFTKAIKSGRAFNGSHRDSGTIVHAVLHNTDQNPWAKALCGTEPGIRGNGWYAPSNQESQKVTCPKCLKKIPHLPESRIESLERDVKEMRESLTYLQRKFQEFYI